MEFARLLIIEAIRQIRNDNPSLSLPVPPFPVIASDRRERSNLIHYCPEKKRIIRLNNKY